MSGTIYISRDSNSFFNLMQEKDRHDGRCSSIISNKFGEDGALGVTPWQNACRRINWEAFP